MLKEFFQTQGEKLSQRRCNKEAVKNIVSGETFIDTRDKQIANIIVRWCDREKNPVDFFSQALCKMGIELPVRIMQLVNLPEYYMVAMKELETGVLRDFYISKIPKNLLRAKIQLLDDEVVDYKVQGEENTVIVRSGRVTVEYYSERVRISIDNWVDDIDITLTGIQNNFAQYDMYKKAKSVIEELEPLDRNMDSYVYYIMAKKVIEKYFDLKGVGIGFYTQLLTIHSCDGMLVNYNNLMNGITIKNYTQGPFKQYEKDGIKFTWQNNKFKCEGVPDENIRKYLDVVEGLIKNVEELEY